MKKYLLWILVLPLLLIGLFSSCSAKPQEIEYGTDGCHFCRMTIVDKQHAAQIVTKKGKAYKFDAIECMVNYRNEMDPESVALYLNNHYTQPGELIDATASVFLISEGIPSPMGAFLTAFATQEEAAIEHNKHGGTLYSWEELLVELNP
ncbi:nitrous oxide reductase accessory protein NosL [Flagellimonas flava]|uniref:Copper chaperone NosL n=1 Tax=Flagellimonas flava TaxID=570519 RepID=A0A1M5PNQ4_9FLAO|nr:nitrous oxide reductase accessory protein NosL [Allomuricauda flava]SHH03455.1 copper chaperone NosL [Allomuricauda flava]